MVEEEVVCDGEQEKNEKQVESQNYKSRSRQFLVVFFWKLSRITL